LVRERESVSGAFFSVAAAVDIARGTVQVVRLALCGVAHKPWRATVAEAALRGGPATEDAFAAAATAELAAARPLRDNAFKVGLAQAVLVQTLNDLVSED
jgi:xanthine dehydrogenase YagS FAD-binding subunit